MPKLKVDKVRKVIYVKQNNPESYFKNSFISLFEFERKPFIPDLAREDNAVLVLQSNIVEPYIPINKPFDQNLFDYDKIIDRGNERFKIEFFHYKEELFDTNKIGDFIPHLRKNPYSKRGVIGLWQENYRDSANPVPCLMNMSFLIRNNGLDLDCHMRANDAYRIFFIDFHILRSIQKYVAEKLDLSVGNYVHFVDSFHIYRRDIELAEKLCKKFKK